jgi:hypothetical protein
LLQSHVHGVEGERNRDGKRHELVGVHPDTLGLPRSTARQQVKESTAVIGLWAFNTRGGLRTDRGDPFQQEGGDRHEVLEGQQRA